MKTNSSFQSQLEQYVFMIADTFIEHVSPEEQQQLLNLVSDMGKAPSQPPKQNTIKDNGPS